MILYQLNELIKQQIDNSGLWTDYKITGIENQKITWFPYNTITNTLFYGQRAAIGEARSEPIVWLLSKVEDSDVRGIARYTWKQDKWNDHTDYIEFNKDGIVTGVWCDYFVNGDIQPTPANEPISTIIYSVISYSGLKPDIKTGGHYKKFTVDFFKGDDPIPFKAGMWEFTIDGVDVSNRLKMLDSTISTDVQLNQIKIKLEKDESLIGKILVVSFRSNDGVVSSVESNIVGF